MRALILLSIMITGLTAMGADQYQVSFSNGVAIFTGNLQMASSGDGFHLKGVAIQVPSQSHGSLYLVSEFGWGDGPYDFICESISQQQFGSDEYKYASAYGYATEIGFLGGLFSSPEFFVVKKDGSFELADSYPNSVYDSGISCFNVKYEY